MSRLFLRAKGDFFMRESVDGPPVKSRPFAFAGKCYPVKDISVEDHYCASKGGCYVIDSEALSNHHFPKEDGYQRFFDLIEEVSDNESATNLLRRDPDERYPIQT